MSTLSIGVTGLNAAMVGLTTTSNNIANQATAGYTRQVVVQGTNGSYLTSAGFVGEGTHVETVKRVYSEYLTQQVLSAQAGAAETGAYYQQISRIDNMLGSTTSGLNSAISEFFGGVQSVVSDPASVSARQSMLSTAQTLTSRFQSLNQQIDELRSGVNAQIVSQTAAINTYAEQIAAVNQRVLYAQAGSMSQPNDLLDQRDQLVSELNQIVGVSTFIQSDGTMTVSFGNGQSLVVGTEAYSLAAEAANDDPNKMVVNLKTPGGASILIPESQITGGSLGGLIAFRNEALDSTQNALGRVAVSLALTFNQQHQLGIDLSGALGGEFFNVGEPATTGNLNNTGTGVLTAAYSDNAATNLTTSDYRLSYDGTNYRLTRLSDNQSWTGASAAAVAATADQGFELSLAGTVQAGDNFKIEPTRSGAATLQVVVSDVREIAAAAPMVASADTANTGSGAITNGSVAGSPLNAAVRNTVSITFTSATTFDVYDETAGTTLATGVAYSAGGDISYNGWTVQISGTPSANDEFSVRANVYGVSDGRNAVALANLQTAKTMIGSMAGGTLHGTASYADAYAQMVSDVGNKTRAAKSLSASQTALADASVAAQQEVSGVNLDEEAANLIRYQQAYQASAKVIDIVSKLFDTLLGVAT